MIQTLEKPIEVRNSFGFWASSIETAPPAPIFQTRTTGGANTNSMTITLPTSSAGNFVMVGIGANRGTTAGNPYSLGSGWTLMLEKYQVNGTSGGLLQVWGKIVSGGESDPTYSISGTQTMTYVAETWTGVASFSAALTGVGYTSAGTFTMTANSVNTTVKNSIVATWIGGRATVTGNVSPSWGAGAATHYDTASGRLGFCNVGTETAATTGSRSHTCQITNSQSAPASCIGSVILSPL